MKGAPIRAMVDEALKRKAQKRKKGGSPKVGTVVREVFEDIETGLRFRYVKYTRCYNDLLAAVLATI